MTNEVRGFLVPGNICRSPIAEAVFVQLLKESSQLDQWKIDSGAIGSWHIGKGPDYRAVSVLSKHGITTPHKARQVKKSDFAEFDYIFGMDDDNMDDLRRLAPVGSKAKIELLGSYDPQGQRLIRDPYYDNGEEGFEECYQQCQRCLRHFLTQLTH